jgi:hypothetical protein
MGGLRRFIECNSTNLDFNWQILLVRLLLEPELLLLVSEEELEPCLWWFPPFPPLGEKGLDSLDFAGLFTAEDEEGVELLVVEFVKTFVSTIEAGAVAMGKDAEGLVLPNRSVPSIFETENFLFGRLWCNWVWPMSVVTIDWKDW